MFRLWEKVCKVSSVDEVVSLLLWWGWDGIGILFAWGESLQGEAWKGEEVWRDESENEERAQ